MTDETTPNRPPMPASPAGLPPDSRAARSLTGRAKPEEARAEEPGSEPEPESGPRIWPRVAGVLLLLAVAGGVWIWQEPGIVQTSMHTLFPGLAGSGSPAQGVPAPADRESEIKDLDARVTRLEQQPAPDDLSRRLEGLEQRLASSGPATGPQSIDLRPLLARLNALEARSAESRSGAAGPDPQPVIARLDALEKQQARETVDPAKIEALSARVDTLAARDPAAEVRGKLDAIEHRLNNLAENQAKLVDNSDRAGRVAQVEAANMALAAGRPLGSIPDAPPALIHFATIVPPTMPTLRLSFIAASQEALKVSQPDTEGKAFLDRVLARLQDFRLITVREGDRVVVGNSTAAALARARVVLDAGDLAGAVREVNSLSGPPSEKMASWLADAKALLAARDALAAMAGNG